MMYIKVLQQGLLNDPESNPKTYTAQEFVDVFGIEMLDYIEDLYFDFDDDEKDKNGHVSFWERGLFVEVWGY